MLSFFSFSIPMSEFKFSLNIMTLFITDFYVTKTRTAILVAILDVGFPAAAILLTQFLLHEEVRIDVAGLLCVIFSMIAYASPLSAMVIQEYILDLLEKKEISYIQCRFKFSCNLISCNKWL